MLKVKKRENWKFYGENVTFSKVFKLTPFQKNLKITIFISINTQWLHIERIQFEHNIINIMCQNFEKSRANLKREKTNEMFGINFGKISKIN